MNDALLLRIRDRAAADPAFRAALAVAPGWTVTEVFGDVLTDEEQAAVARLPFGPPPVDGQGMTPHAPAPGHRSV
jgi:hypothetical protein